MTQEIGYCGNHCAYCFFTECDGCRRNNPSCSYANLFEDKKCPNAICCADKNMNGCWQCEKVKDCGKGFFSSGENDAKAYALYIKKYGTEQYTRTILNLMRHGYNYPEAFKSVNDVDKILDIFENKVKKQW